MTSDFDFRHNIMTDFDFSYSGINLVMTCGACPEQYDAYNKEGHKVGYFRLRHGFFSVDAYNPGGHTVYESNPAGDGIFDYSEREHELKSGIDALVRYLNDF